jgi:hypothetical protein
MTVLVLEVVAEAADLHRHMAQVLYDKIVDLLQEDHHHPALVGTGRHPKSQVEYTASQFTPSFSSLLNFYVQHIFLADIYHLIYNIYSTKYQ